MVSPKKRLWLPTLAEGPVALDAERAHYARNVLRLTDGDELTVLSGDGRLGVARLVGNGLEVSELRDAPLPPSEVTVAVAVPKGDRADWTVEKLTELGVTRLLWLACARSVSEPREGGSRQTRWRRLAEAAAKQSGRARTLEIEGPVDFTTVLERSASLRLIAHPGGGSWAEALGGDLSRPMILIGPEGGFTPDELLQAGAAGYAAVTLGPHILRVETAAVASAAVLVARAQ
jgi:16S rRNA (uracil1498-N3)-methyltransferase